MKHQEEKIQERSIAIDEFGLRVDNVSLRFNGLIALDDVTLVAPRGSITGIIGPNGAGKSSLLNCINGFYSPSSGDIRWGQTSLIGHSPHQLAGMSLARTFQGLELFKGSSVIDNILLGRHRMYKTGAIRCSVDFGAARREENENRARVEEILRFFSIASYRNRVVGELSYGIQKIVAIARAVAMEPELLLLDEPTSGMNRGEKAEIASIIRDLNQESGLTQVLIEHDMKLIRSVCDHVIVLNFGKVIAAGKPSEVLNDRAVIEAYVGRQAE